MQIILIFGAGKQRLNTLQEQYIKHFILTNNWLNLCPSCSRLTHTNMRIMLV